MILLLWRYSNHTTLPLAFCWVLFYFCLPRCLREFVQAYAMGKKVGVVSTARITHATPAAVYARSADRKFEASVPEECTEQKDIALQVNRAPNYWSYCRFLSVRSTPSNRGTCRRLCPMFHQPYPATIPPPVSACLWFFYVFLVQVVVFPE